MTPDEFNVCYIAHNLNRSVQDILSAPADEYMMWCRYFRQANGIVEKKPVTQKEKNAVLLKQTPFFASLSKHLKD